MKFIQAFKRTILIAVSLFMLTNAKAQITGTWKGSLAIPNTSIELFIHIEHKQEAYSVKLDIPEQGLINHPAEKVRFSDNTIQITFQSLNMQYIGNLNDNEQKITGTFIQNGFEIPLEFLKVSNKIEATVKRSQQPVNNNDYIEESVRFLNKSANIHLSGTLTLPKNYNKKTPIAILISGSGAQDRNSTIMGHQPFLVLADYLTRQGIGVLRYDDRGVGESEGAELLAQSTTGDLATDTEAALAYLKGRKFKNIGLIGHSEGGAIAPMVAASNTSTIKFIVLLAAQGVSGDSIIIHQAYTGSKAENVADEVAVFNREFTRTITRFVKNYPGSNLPQDLSTLLDATLNQQDPITKSIDPATKAAIKNNILNSFTSPWMKYYLRLDPAVYLSKVKCPILAIHGTKDIQVPFPENQQGMRSILEKSKHKKYVLLTGEQLNHLMQTSIIGAVSEYDKIEETMAPFVLESIAKWIEGLH